MFISHKFKLIFIHIPKTAGCSVEDMIKRNDPTAFQTKYMHDSIINNKEFLDKYSDYYKFSVVRNCWELCASCYRFECKGIRYKPVDRTFENWFIWKCNNKHPNHNPFPKQLKYFTDGNNNIILDKICRFKNLNNDIKEVCKDTGMKFSLEKKRHFYGNYNWKDYYNKKSYNLVYQACKKDIKYFNWEF